MRLSHKIKNLRERAAWTQEQLAYASGVSEKTIQRLEKGQKVREETLRCIASAFDIDVDILLTDNKHITSIKEEFGTKAKYLSEHPDYINTSTIQNMLDLLGTNMEILGTAYQNKIALDLACGPGILTPYLAKYFKQVNALDITEEMLAQAKLACEKENFENVNFIKANAEQIPLDNESVDLIVNRLSMHLFGDKQRVLKEVARILQKEGVLILADYLSPEDSREAKSINSIEQLKYASTVAIFQHEQYQSLFSEIDNLILEKEVFWNERRVISSSIDITNDPVKGPALFQLLTVLAQESHLENIIWNSEEGFIEIIQPWVAYKLRKI